MRLQLVIQLIFGCNMPSSSLSETVSVLQLVIQLIFGCNSKAFTRQAKGTRVTVGDSTNIWL